MNWHLLLTDNIDQLDTQPDTLVTKCSLHFGREFAVYRPLPFVDHTGFTETVEEEIEFVIEAQRSTDGAYLSAEELVGQWNLSHLVGLRVAHLSGGWRKFLGIALFANRKASAKCFLDVTSHLADERVRVLLEQLESQSNEAVVFCEYDSRLIFDLAPSRFSLLLERDDRVERVERFPIQGTKVTTVTAGTAGTTGFYSNYEQY
jgi:hypothetical protein